MDMNEKALQRSVAYIEDWLRLQQEHGDTPGFVVAIAHKGKVIFNEAYGQANLEKKEKLTTDHIFRIASHSKTFTATSIFQLQEQGKLRIDDYVVEYLPWLKAHTDERVNKITIRQLLSHGAGVIRDGSKSGYWQLEYPFPDEEEFKKDVLGSKLVIDNNTKLKYSNYGYTLLGMIIQSVSGQTYNDYVQQNIINKLNLSDTGAEFSEKIADRIVTGYTRPDFNKKPLPIANIDTKIMAPATGFYSTSADLCRYFSAHVVGSGELLDDESKKEMQRIQWQAENTAGRTYYCLGLEADYVNKRRYLGHGGGFPGHLTKSFFDPSRELVVTVLTNSLGSWSSHMGKSVIKVLDYFQEDTSAPKWQKYQGRYMNIWWIIDVVAAGDKLIVGEGDSWEPFIGAEELEHTSGDIFKVSKASSFSSIDEPVEFKTNSSGVVTEVIYAGGIMLPEKEYFKQMSKKKIIDL